MPTPPLQGLVQGDPGEPSRKRRFAPEGRQACEGLEVGVLQHVLGLTRIAEHRTRNSIEPPIVTAHDFAKSSIAARPRENRNLGVIQPFEVGSYRLPGW